MKYKVDFIKNPPKDLIGNLLVIYPSRSPSGVFASYSNGKLERTSINESSGEIDFTGNQIKIEVKKVSVYPYFFFLASLIFLMVLMSPMIINYAKIHDTYSIAIIALIVFVASIISTIIHEISKKFYSKSVKIEETDINPKEVKSLKLYDLRLNCNAISFECSENFYFIFPEQPWGGLKSNHEISQKIIDEFKNLGVELSEHIPLEHPIFTILSKKYQEIVKK